MEKYGFVYIWYDRKHKRFYMGSHWGREDDGYICSSNWMRNAYKRRPNDFKRRILSRIYSKEKLLFEEYNWLQLIKKEELGKKYYNHTTNNFAGIGYRSITTGIKISKSLKGKHLSEETKRKISVLMKGRILTEEWKQKIGRANKGRIHSEEFKLKCSNRQKGKRHSEETKRKMSLSHKKKRSL